MTYQQSDVGTNGRHFPFNRGLAVCVFTLENMGYSEGQIASELAVDINRIQQILSKVRVRDGVVKAHVTALNYGRAVVESLKLSASAKSWH